MFILIMASIYKHTRNMSVLKEKTPAEDLKDTKKNFIIAMSLAVVLGLGWGFGLLATSSEIEELTFTFQVIFAIFVGFQGVFIFFLHGIRNADFREFWIKLLKIKEPRPSSRYTVSNSEKAHMTVRNSGSGSGTGSVALSSRSSAPEKTDLSKKSTSAAFTSEMNSFVQSPTDSVFTPGSELCSELPSDANALDMKPNECYQTVRTSNSRRLPDVKPSDMQQNECYQTLQTDRSAGDSSMNAPRYEEIEPRFGGMHGN